MFTFLIVLIIIASVLLTIVVLAQNPKGGGLSSQFGGTGTSQLMGVKRTGDFLEKITWGLAIAIVAFSLTSFIYIRSGKSSEGGISTPGMQKANEQPIIDMNQQQQQPVEDPFGSADEGQGEEPDEDGSLENLLQQEEEE